MTLHVTNILVTVTGDVTRDTPTVTAAQSVHLDSLDLTAKNVVEASVLTMNHVTSSVECVLVVVRTGILEHIVKPLVMKVFTAETAPKFVLLIV